MKRESKTPTAYRADVPERQRELLETIRSAILKVAPDVEEGIDHGMLDYPGLANLAAQKHYVSLYVAPSVLDRHRDAFPDVEAGKSCLRFRRAEQAKPRALEKLLRDVRKYRAARD